MEQAVSLEVRTDREYLLVADQTQLLTVLVQITPLIQGAAGSAPVNLSLVLDRSGSMSGDKLDNVKQAVNYIIDNLSSNDRVSVVAFDNGAPEIVLSSTYVTDKEFLKSRVGQVGSQGGTSISSGLAAGLREVAQGAGSNITSRIVLLTDGETFGDEDECLQLASQAGEQGIPVNALGVGDDWNEELLVKIASNSKGRPDWVRTSEAIIPIFRSELTSLQSVVARNVNITLRLIAGVSPKAAYRIKPELSLLGFESVSDKFVSVAAGDLEEGKPHSMLVELRVAPRDKPGRYRVAQAEVSFDVPALSLTGEKVRSDVVASFTEDAALAKKLDPEIKNLAERAGVLKMQQRAQQQIEAGDVTGGASTYRNVTTLLTQMGEMEMAEVTAKAAEEVEKDGVVSKGTKKLQEFGTRDLSKGA